MNWPPPETATWTREEQALVGQLSPDALPKHLAVIMDGNGRWARKLGLLDRVRGHEAGIESVREIVRSSGVLGIETLTLYSFSSENWTRPRHEVMALMALLERFLVQERGELMDNGVQLRSIGRSEDLPAAVQKVLAETIELTQNNRGLKLVLALSYGARDEIVRAIRSLATEVKAGKLDPEAIDVDLVAGRLDTAEFGDPDLLIRTSGEMRISNFLLWQLAYTELHVTPVLWPDFRKRHLVEGLLEYQSRDRRFGGLSERADKELQGKGQDSA